MNKWMQRAYEIAEEWSHVDIFQYEGDFAKDLAEVFAAALSNAFEAGRKEERLPVVSVPTGWKLVPEELTAEMSAEINLTGTFAPKAMQARYTALLAAAPQPPMTEVEPCGEPGETAMRVIFPDQWEPCSPDYLARGGDCANAPRVWNAATCNHWHPKLTTPPASLREENERLERERAEQWRLRREMEASRDTEQAIAATYKDRATAAEQRLAVVEEALRFYACQQPCDCLEGKEDVDSVTCGFRARAALKGGVA